MAELLTVVGTPTEPQADTLRARIGPNAVIQLAAALREQRGERATSDIFARAGLQPMLAAPPEQMVEQSAVARLYRALFRHLPAEQAAAAAADAGTRTADYLLANRIPRPARFVLRSLPAPLASRLLLRAIAANAWTFAGSGRVAVHPGRTGVIEILDNPIAMPGCVWHIAVFERLFRTLVSPLSTVRHPACRRTGSPACRFEIGSATTGRR